MEQLVSQLLPLGHRTALCAFSSNDLVASVTPDVVLVPMEDKLLGVHKSSSKTPPRKLVVPPLPSASCRDNIPLPSAAWEAFYPAGSINPNGDIPGGFGLYLSGPPEFRALLQGKADTGGAKEAIFSYRMMLQEDWEWVKGGKLPGIYGGEGEKSYGCTGGRQEQRCKCFNLRPMWRPAATGELYAYLPLTPGNSQRLSAVPPKSTVNSDYGISVGRGAYKLQKAVGAWVAIAFRVKLNDVMDDGTVVNNGELEMWVDGNSVIHADGLQFRDSKTGRIGGMHFQTFFGGHTSEWASPKDQRAWFADITGAILE